jgi:hypothetical protein
MRDRWLRLAWGPWSGSFPSVPPSPRLGQCALPAAITVTGAAPLDWNGEREGVSMRDAAAWTSRALARGISARRKPSRSRITSKSERPEAMAAPRGVRVQDYPHCAHDDRPQ